MYGGEFVSFNLRNLFKKITEPSGARTTFFRAFEPIHNTLIDRSPYYRNWHALPYVSVIHTAVIITSVFVTIAIMLALVFSSPRVAQSASLTWDGGGSTNNWSECANWTTDTCPTSADAVNFNTTSTKDSSVDVSFGGVLATFTISSGYTGTITLARSLNVTGAFSQATGTFTAGSQTLDVDGNFTLSGGTHNASSGTTYIGRAITVTNSPTFNHNNGTVEFDGPTNDAFSCGNITFNLVRITATAGQKTINTGCTFPMGADPSLAFNIRLNGGTLSGSGTIAFTGQFIHSGGTLSGFTGITVFSTFTVSGGTIDLSNYNPRTLTSGTIVSSGTLTVPNDFTFTNSFTLNGGTFNAPSGTVTFNSTFTASSGTFNHNNGTVAFSGATTATLSCTVATFNQVTFTHTNQTKTVSSNCTMPLGANPTVTGPINLLGTLSGSGTITYNSTMTMNTTGAFSGFSGVIGVSSFIISGGDTVNFGSYSTVDFNGTFTLTSGTFTAPSGTMTIANNITYTAGTFNHNNGTVVLDGSAGTINCGSMSFNLVRLDYTSAKTVSSGCTLPLGADPTLPSSMTLSGTLSGSGTLTVATNTLTMGSGANLSGFTGFSKGAGTGSLTIAGATVDFSSYTSTVINGLTISSGSFTAPSGTMVTGSFTYTGGTFNANGGTIDWNTSGSSSCGGATFNLILINQIAGSGTRSLSNCTAPLGTNPTVGKVTLTNSTLTGTGTLTADNVLTLNAGSNISGFDTFVSNNVVTIAGADIDFGSLRTADFNNTLTMSSGTFTAPSSSGTMTVATTMTFTGGTFNANGGTVTFDGSSATLSCNNITFNKVAFSHNGTKTINSDCSLPLGENPTISNSIALNGTLSGSGRLTTTTGTLTLNSGSSLSGFSSLVSGSHLTINGATLDLGSMSLVDINGNFTLSSGTFTAPTGTMTVSGAWNTSGGTFNHNNGTVELDGNAQEIIGTTTFYNLKKTVSNRYILTLPANTTQTILGNLILHGVGGKNLLLRSKTAGTQFSIDPRGNRDMSFLDLKDANNVNGTRINIAGTSSYNAGNNTGWSFSTPGVTNLGSAGMRDGSYAKTTQPTFSFDTSDQDASDGDTLKYQIQIDDSSDYGSTLVDYTSKLAAPGSYTFTVGQAAGDGVYATGTEGQKLSDGGYYWRIHSIDSSGATSVYTNGKDNSIAFGIDTTAPTAPGLPKVSGDTNDTTPTWTWSVASDSGAGLATTDTYTFEWCNNSRFEGCATAIKTTDTTVTNSPLDVTTWFARVKAKDKLDQESSWSEVGIYNLQGSTTPSSNDASTSETSAMTEDESDVIKVPSVSLKVVGSDGQPIAGAKTILYSTPRTAITNENGVAIFTDVEVGEHRLVISYKDKIGIQRLVVEADGSTSSLTNGEGVSAPGEELTVSIQDSEPLISSVALLAFRIIGAVLIILMYLLHLRRHHDFDYFRKSNDRGII